PGGGWEAAREAGRARGGGNRKVRPDVARGPGRRLPGPLSGNRLDPYGGPFPGQPGLWVRFDALRRHRGPGTGCRYRRPESEQTAGKATAPLVLPGDWNSDDH